MALGRIIRQRRKEMGLTLDKVADVSGFSKPYLSTIETNKVKNPPSDDLLAKLEHILKFEKGYLVKIAHLERLPADIRFEYEQAEVENQKLRDFVNGLSNSSEQVQEAIADGKIELDSSTHVAGLVPVFNNVSAGYPVDFDDMDYPAGIADDYIRCPDILDDNAFAVRVNGDSMETSYFQGDIVVFSPKRQVNSGDDCLVRFKEPHETTFKRVFFDDGKIVRLQPRNNKYSPMIIEADRIDGIYRAVRRIQVI